MSKLTLLRGSESGRNLAEAPKTRILKGVNETNSLPARVRPRHVWAVASTPRMLGFALVILLAVFATVWLGTWQLDRALAKAEQTQAAEMAARLEAPAEPLEEIVEPQTQFVQSMVGQRVEVEGTLEGPEFFVPRKFMPDPDDPKNKDLWTHGYWILTPLRTDAGAIMPVIRGWVEDDDAAYLNAEGLQVRAIGALDGTDGAGEEVSGNTIGSVSTGQLANIWDGPLYSGYMIATSIDGAPDVPDNLPEIVAAPTPVLEGGGLNFRNLAYAAEWFVFGGFALAVWWRMIRDDSRDLAAAESSEDSSIQPEK